MTRFYEKNGKQYKCSYSFSLTDAQISRIKVGQRFFTYNKIITIDKVLFDRNVLKVYYSSVKK